MTLPDLCSLAGVAFVSTVELGEASCPKVCSGTLLTIGSEESGPQIAYNMLNVSLVHCTLRSFKLNLVSMTFNHLIKLLLITC